MRRAKHARSWFAFVLAYIDMKWPRAAATTRNSMTDALATVTAALVDDRPGQPEVVLLRRALRQYALVPSSRTLPRPAEVAAALGWLERASLPLTELEKPRNVRLALDALTLRLDGTAAAATTIHRKRSVFYNVLGYAAELEELSANPLDRVKWKPPKVAEVVDRRVVVNPRQARELLTAVTYVGRPGVASPAGVLRVHVLRCAAARRGQGTTGTAATCPRPAGASSRCPGHGRSRTSAGPTAGKHSTTGA